MLYHRFFGLTLFRVLVDGVVVGNFSINSTTYHCQNDPLMLGRSIVSYYPSGDPNSATSNEYLLFSSSPTFHDGNMYFCMAHVVLSMAGTPGYPNWDLRASTKAVRVVLIPSNAAPPWLDPSPDVYRIVADAFQNAWSCASNSAIIDNGHFIGGSQSSCCFVSFKFYVSGAYCGISRPRSRS